MIGVRGGLLALGLACTLPAYAQDSFDREGDLRRDATVRAVEAVGPAVANIATEEVVADRLALEGWSLEEWQGRRPAKRTASSLGSGVVVDPAGYLLTNAHVVSRASRIVVTLPGRAPLEAKLLAIHPVDDLALLRVAAPEPLPSARLAAPGVLIGETCIALGNPFGLENTVTRGVLSARGRKLRHRGRELPGGFLQTDAAINPGNSGGPLVNLHAEVIGLNTAIHTSGKGIGFAIPVDRLRSALSTLSDPHRLRGRYLGLTVRDTDDDVGAHVVSVEPGGPAALVGIRAGDRIVAAGPDPVGTAFSFHRAFLGDRSAQRLALVGPDGKRRGVTLAASEPPYRRAIRARLGLVASDLDRTLSWRHGVSGSGLLVQKVVEGGPAAKLGIRPGDVVLKIARRSRAGLRIMEIQGQRSLASFLERLDAEERVVVTLRRKGQEFWGELRVR